MFDPEIEVAVNYEFTQMLKALEARGFFGTEETCLPAFKAIAIECNKRSFVMGQSVGASIGSQIRRQVNV
jgi:hypothetical protein